MDVSEGSIVLIGSVAAVCTTGAFVPQVVRLWRLRSAAEISLLTFLVFSVGTFAWLVYGLLIRSLPVIGANAVTLGLALTMVVLKLRYDRGGPTPRAT
jgi:MtN3 and saliva related transmembrane protein